MRNSSWISITIAFFNQFTGIGVVNMFAVTIFYNIHKLGALSRLSQKQETYYIGLTGIIGAILSYYSIGWFSRKAIFVGGHFFMGLFLFICGYLIDQRLEDLTLISLCLFVISF